MKALDYKAITIRNAERANGLEFFTSISKLSTGRFGVTDLMFLYECGGATADDFSKDFKTGMNDVVLNIFKYIDEAGFLGEKIDLEAMAQEMGLSTKASQKSGKTDKE